VDSVGFGLRPTMPDLNSLDSSLGFGPCPGNG
jgi:hypothetical protein